MSSAWGIYIAVITLVTIAGCYWLILWSSKKRPGEAAEGDVTGHTWDGLQEFNNPLPRWWLWLFYITIIFGLAYMAVYPGLGIYEGAFGWSAQSQYEEEMQAAEATYGPIFKKFASQPVAELATDPEAQAAGQRLFLTYCSQCHGSDAGGAPGYPNLADGDWLYGGSPDAIKTSILSGRQGIMPAMGAALGDDGVDQVAAYVMSLSGRSVDPAQAAAGKTKFESLCAACHTAEGTGNQAIGAPDLTDNVWLYGARAEAIKKTIREGRNGVMPAHKEFLGEDKSHLLAAYVYSLSAGK